MVGYYVRGSVTILSIRKKDLVLTVSRLAEKILNGNLSDLSRDCIIGVVEELIDSDGNIEKRRREYICIAISSTNERVRDFLLKICIVLGLKRGCYVDLRPSRSPRYRIHIFNGLEIFSRSCKVRRFLRDNVLGAQSS